MKRRPNTQNGFLLVNRETQCDPMLADSFQLAAGSTTIATGFSGISSFSVTPWGSWSQWQKSYRLLGSFRGTTGALQRWAPSWVRGKEEQTKTLGILTGAESWRTGLLLALERSTPPSAAEHKEMPARTQQPLHSRWLRSSSQQPSLAPSHCSLPAGLRPVQQGVWL